MDSSIKQDKDSNKENLATATSSKGSAKKSKSELKKVKSKLSSTNSNDSQNTTISLTKKELKFDANGIFGAATDPKDPEAKLKQYENEGVICKVKLIGSELVIDPRGDKMCQNSIQRLKAIIKGTSSHKKRILFKISYDGVKIYDEKTNEILHHHKVPEISYVVGDETDPRTFGYVCDVPNNAHLFVCFKTMGPAIKVMTIVSDLFDAVLEKKKRNDTSNEFHTTTQEQPAITEPPSKTISFDEQPKQQKKEPLNADMILISGVDDDFPIFDNTQAAVRASTIVYNNSSASLAEMGILNRVMSNTSSGFGNDSPVDRYAVFSDIDNLPSIFESTATLVEPQVKLQPTPTQPPPKAQTVNNNDIFARLNPFEDDFFS